MRTMVFRCPETGEEVDSGLQVDVDSLRYAILLEIPMRCPHCGERHTFQATSAEFSKAA